MKINVSQLISKLDLYSYFLGLFGSLIPLNVCSFLTANYSLRLPPLQWLFVWLFIIVNGLKKKNGTTVLHSVWARVRVICIGKKKVTILRGNVTHAALRCQFGNVGTKTCAWVCARCPRLNDREFFNICPQSLLINCVECGHTLSAGVIHFTPSLSPWVWSCGGADCRECDREVDRGESAVISESTLPPKIPSLLFFR